MTSSNNIQKLLLSTADVARYLGISERFAKNLIYSGSLPSLKVGRLRRVRRDDLDRWIDRQSGCGGDELDTRQRGGVPHVQRCL
jgi:excisionase family DNA binding protein